jgi:branched-subunit amino acid aminotransferase/4-amino-4-deoxychorismate lyase
LFLVDHFERLEASAALSGLPVSLDHTRLRGALRTVLGEALRGLQGGSRVHDYRIRIVLDLESNVGDLFFALTRLQTPSDQEYERGVAVILNGLQRSLPEAKLTSFISKTAEIGLPSWVNEALLVDEQGCILEGMSSNFYAVLKGKLYTAGEGVLPGLTRQLVLEEAGLAGITVILQAPALQSIPDFEEAFLTSTSRGVLPVNQIAGQVIGSGKPGQLTQAIARRYQERVQQLLEEV